MKLWTADSIEIRADQTCWTADGYNGCKKRKKGGAQFDNALSRLGQERIIREDEEIISFIMSMITKGIL